MNKRILLVSWCLAALIISVSSLPAQEHSSMGNPPKRFLWVWLQNLDGRWKEYIDFAADWKCTGVVIWGLDGWKAPAIGGPTGGADEALCRQIVTYAHERGVWVVHGFGLNGYHEGQHICKQAPGTQALIPERLRNTEKGKDSAGNIFCPSNPEALKLLREMLLRAADTGIDGFNFETADVDYVTCHCPACEGRFQSAAEEEHTNKPPRWSIEQTNWAVNALRAERPRLWLSVEFAMQRFGAASLVRRAAPYLDSPTIDQINREIDEGITLVWSEATYPPQPVCEKLAAGRRNIGFYLRSAEFAGWAGTRKIRREDIVGTVRRLWPLHPQAFMYRSWYPLDRWAVNLAVAAEAMRDPARPDAWFADIEKKVEALTAPGQKYTLIEKVVPGNLLSADCGPTITCSSEDLWRTGMFLADGVAEPGRGMWFTERNNPKQAWVEVRWPKPRRWKDAPHRIGRVRLYHQMDGHYRSLDYVVEYWDNGKWTPVEGMPVRDNKVQGWREHEFAPVTADRLRVFITRSAYGNRMGLGELEAYESR